MINLKKEKQKLSLSGAPSEPIISAEPKENQPRYSVNCQAISKYDRFYFVCAKVLAFALLISFNLSPSFAADCVPETTIINGVEKPLVACDGNMYKYTYDSSGNATNMSVYEFDGSDWEKSDNYIYTYDSSGNLERSVWYNCGSGNCEEGYEVKYKLDTAPDGTKIAKEIYYGCSNGVCTKDTEEFVYAYNGDTFTGDWNSYVERGYYRCDDPDYECDTELPQSISATPFCPKGCNGCDVERACSSCAEGYKAKNGTCLSRGASCGDGYVEGDGVCYKIPDGCESASATDGSCTKCSAGLSFDDDNNCIECNKKGYKNVGGYCNRVQWTPAEAAEVLTDDNNNSVTITFKK